MDNVVRHEGSDGASSESRPVKLSCDRLWKVFGDKASETVNPATGNPDPHLVAKAGCIAALRDVTLEISTGEIFVIMGLSGSGKSTLVRCLSLLIQPTTGTVLFENRDLLKMSSKELIQLRRHKMGMVFQHFALLPHLTVRDNVAFPLEIQGVGVAARAHRADEMIQLVGLEGREEYYPRELSGGQRQRVGIARSLAVEPELWFLDEPFSALDPLIRRELQTELMRLQDMLHKTIVFITHDFDEAIRLADRIAILKDGVVEQLGTPEQIVLSPATQYVAEFTQHVPKAKVVSVGSIMRRGGELRSDVSPIPIDVPIEQVARRVLESDEATPVIDRSGRSVGSLSRADVVAAIFPK